MKPNHSIKIYGDTTYRDRLSTKKPTREEDIQIACVSWVDYNHPEHRALLIHPINEGKKTQGRASIDQKMGLTKGASDLIILNRINFICELKREDITKAKWGNGQQEFLLANQENGAFVCVVISLEGFKEAFNDWLDTLHSSK